MLGARGAAFAWNWRAGRLAGRKLGTTARDKDSEKSMSSLSKLSFFRRFAALHVVAAPLLGQGIPLQDWYAFRTAIPNGAGSAHACSLATPSP